LNPYDHLEMVDGVSAA